MMAHQGYHVHVFSFKLLQRLSSSYYYGYEANRSCVPDRCHVVHSINYRGNVVETIMV